MLTSVLVCVGVMDTCGRLKSRGGRGFYGWWGFKSVSKILLGRIVESFRWLLLVYFA